MSSDTTPYDNIVEALRKNIDDLRGIMEASRRRIVELRERLAINNQSRYKKIEIFNEQASEILTGQWYKTTEAHHVETTIQDVT